MSRPISLRACGNPQALFISRVCAHLQRHRSRIRLPQRETYVNHDLATETLQSQMRKSVMAALIAIVVLATAITYFAANRFFEAQVISAADNRLVLYQRAVNEKLRQHQHLPFLLARDPRYSDLLDPSNLDPDLNDRLNLLANEAKLEAIYIMDRDGLVLASSNAGQKTSFLGQNYSFRPYFQEALQGKRSDYFAIGATSGRPGYFVAERARFANGRETGVIAIKLDVSELQSSWEQTGEAVLAVNTDGIVVLASNPAWLYRPLMALPPEALQSILSSRQFGTEQLIPLRWAALGKARVQLGDEVFLMAAGDTEWRDWRVIYLHPEADVTSQTLLATALFGSIVAVLVGFATYLRSRRIELAYASSERQRAKLTIANAQLEQAQADLARTAKLAALGHLAGSVTHELGQPISAFRNHLAAAEISGEITSPDTASNLNKLVARMEAIILQFRYFARGRAEAKTQVAISSIIQGAADMMAADIRRADVALVTDITTDAVVLAHVVQLEQALINLLKNALHAVAGQPAPWIGLTVTETSETVLISVSDNGHGLSGKSLKDLQEPFFSTKPSGIGMGLGLSIASEIVRDHGGTLTLGTPAKGAEFCIELPLASRGGKT